MAMLTLAHGSMSMARLRGAKRVGTTVKRGIK
jgi:hypothetical protein